MAKKHLLITLGLLITSQANGMAAMRNFGLWAKTWYKTAIFSSFATWHASYKFKQSALCKDSFETTPSSAVTLENPDKERLTNEIHYKEFDKKQDTDFLLECLQKDAYFFLSSNIKSLSEN